MKIAVKLHSILDPWLAKKIEKYRESKNGFGIYLELRSIRHFFQRLLRGWDDGDTYSLDHKIAEFTFPRLKRFKELRGTRPEGFTQLQWDNILDSIIFSMLHVMYSCEWEEWQRLELLSMAPQEEWTKKLNEGLINFGKHFYSLWW